MGPSPGRLRRLAASLATIAMLFAAAGPLAFGHAAVDRDCAPALAEEHDHAGHRITSTSDEAPDHCGACHLTRTVREHAPAHQLARDLRAPQLIVLLASGSIPPSEDQTEPTRGPPHN